MNKENNRGFTATELMITVAIVAILGVVAAPNLMAMRNQQKLNAASRDVYSALQMARMTAIKERCTVIVEFNLSNTGYTVFADRDGDGEEDQDAAEVLRVRGQSGDDTFDGCTFQNCTFGANNQAKFDTRGFARAGGAGGFGNGEIEIRHDSGVKRRVTLSPSGMSRITYL